MCYLLTEPDGITLDASSLLHNAYIIDIKTNRLTLYHKPWFSISALQARYFKVSALAWYGAHRRWNGLMLGY